MKQKTQGQSNFNTYFSVSKDGVIDIRISGNLNVLFTPKLIILNIGSFHLYSCPDYDYDDELDLYDNWFVASLAGVGFANYGGRWFKYSQGRSQDSLV